MSQLAWIDDENDAELLAAWRALGDRVGDLAGWQYRGSRKEGGRWLHGFLHKRLRDEADTPEDDEAAHWVLPATAGWSPGAQVIPAEGLILQTPLKDILASIPQQPQRQDATNAQLQDLRAFAIRLGLYDADDVLCSLLDRK